MNYIVITSIESFESQQFEIDLKDVEIFQKKKKILGECFDMECIYDQLIEEFWEYRNKVYYWKLKSISIRSDYIIGHEIRSSINRLAFNVLNLGKSYLDRHYHKQNKKCFASDLSNNKEHRCIVEKQREEIRSTNLQYIAGVKLRNSAQHTTPTVPRYSIGIQNSIKEDKLLGRWVSLKINYSYEELIKLGVPKKLLSPDLCLDLTNIIDGYIFAISKMHFQNRELLQETINNAKQTIIDIFKQKVTSAGYEKYIIEIEVENGETLYAGLEWFEVVNYLNKKHRYPIDYSKISFDDTNLDKEQKKD